jgi:predicted RNase H-like nuclease
MPAIGVDACRNGWVAAAIDGGAITSIEYTHTVDDLATMFPDATSIGIDIPIGLPTNGSRRADLEAKQLLKDRRSSVFLTPPRAVLEAATHAEATKLAVDLVGAGISQQSYALRSKIFEVERWITTSPPCDVREVHPEVSFALLLGSPASTSKKRWGGMTERRDALERVGLGMHHISSNAAKFAAVDDVIDAAVAAWSAERIAEGRAQSFPDRGAPPERIDETIWA